jgi:alpha-L-fucosidase
MDMLNPNSVIPEPARRAYNCCHMTPRLLFGAAVLLAAAMARATEAPDASEPYDANQASLQQYRCPEWFRDAKFGIWAHWGPQSVPEDGDWYARRLYLSGRPVPRSGLPHFQPGSEPDRGYKLQVERYGHPSKVGYKDIIPLWKAEKWDPDALMDLYVRAGAKYFVSMGVHHDNFDLWDSKYQPRWNSVQMGPKRDVVATWQQAAQKRGLKFGVSEHLGASFTWFQVNKGADLTGPMAGVPYDGNDPKNWDLYHPPTKPDDNDWLTTDPRFHQVWLNRITDLVDHYHPDLLYSDSKFPFGEYGARLVAHYYNSNRAFHGGQMTAVYTCKEDPKPNGWVRDIERGVMTEINPQPWQTDTSIGDWFYRQGEEYKSATQIIHMLADIVSKNGNLLINVVQKPNGEITPEARHVLEEMAAWMAVNGEAIFGTRPWAVYGEGPSTERRPEANRFGGARDVPTKPYTAADLRFTRKGRVLYAIALGQPAEKSQVKSLAGVRVAGVSVLGSVEQVKWTQDAGGLTIEPLAKWPTPEAVVFKIELQSD